MRTAKRIEILEFAATLQVETGDNTYRVACLADLLIRLATKYGKISVRECNEGNTTRTEQAASRIEKKVAELLRRYGITATWNGDPRGAALQLHLPKTKRTNGFCAEGYCVPELGA